MAKERKRRALSRTAESILRAEETKARIRAACAADTEQVLALLDGEVLSEADVQARREKFGVNALPAPAKKGAVRRLLAAFVNPFTAILAVLAVVSLLTDVVFAAADDKNFMTVIVIAVMVAVSGVLRFVQESRSGAAAARLSALIESTATVVRGGQEREIAVGELVVGDVVRLSAGDRIPADLRIVAARDLFVSQSALTGESAPAEKTAAPADAGAGAGCACLALLGSDVVSGSGAGAVVATGADTVLGQTARSLAAWPEKTAFERGMDAVSKILIGFMLAMVPVVFLLNGLTKGDWLSAVLFSVSIAVGLTPEMLPMIVTACLAKGAVALSRKKVIVKDLNAIQNLGTMDVLCTDKTGTLTLDKVVLEYHCNVEGEEDAGVLAAAYLNSNYQTGLKNLMDVAIVERARELSEDGILGGEPLARYVKADEIPFDFERRRMSVVVCDEEGRRRMITKGAVEEMLAVSAYARIGGKIVPLDDAHRAAVRAHADAFNERGLRVLAVAVREDPPAALSAADERDMVLVGYLAFLDPPKATTAAAIERLQKAGVAVKVLTGDNEKVTAFICRKVGLAGSGVLLGSDLELLNDEQLARAAADCAVFAKLSPVQKARVVRVLREAGHAVGFLGDGINDAPAMRAADVGISVDTAADIARDAAGVILLEKDLTVVADGVTEGRRTHANMMKYVKITASSNFGNMFSVLVASAFLPFLPMLSLQLVLLNFVYDLSCTAIPWDNVDAESLASPAVWDARSLARFMVRFGPVSSLFDIATFALLWFVLCPAACGGAYGALDGAGQEQFAMLFRTGWFVASILTQTLVVHLLRSPKFPFIRTHASLPVCLFTAGGAALLCVLPYTAFGRAVGLCALPAVWFAVFAGIVVAYVSVAQLCKFAYVRRFGELL